MTEVTKPKPLDGELVNGIKYHEYVTIDSKEPERSKSFTETRKFKVLGVVLVVFVFVVSYWIFSH